MRAIRLSFVGELGWELHIPNDSAQIVYKTIMAAGKQYDIVNAGYRAIDSLSIEKGLLETFTSLHTEVYLSKIIGFYLQERIVLIHSHNSSTFFGVVCTTAIHNMFCYF